jgi:hypothetical protein
MSSKFPPRETMSRGRWPIAFSIFGFAPTLRRKSMTSFTPLSAAKCSGKISFCSNVREGRGIGEGEKEGDEIVEREKEREKREENSTDLPTVV